MISPWQTSIQDRRCPSQLVSNGIRVRSINGAQRNLNECASVARLKYPITSSVRPARAKPCREGVEDQKERKARRESRHQHDHDSAFCEDAQSRAQASFRSASPECAIMDSVVSDGRNRPKGIVRPFGLPYHAQDKVGLQLPTLRRMRIGIDTGGTFTDFVVVRDGRIEVFKRFSTPRQPEAAILDGLDGSATRGSDSWIHGRNQRVTRAQRCANRAADDGRIRGRSGYRAANPARALQHLRDAAGTACARRTALRRERTHALRWSDRARLDREHLQSLASVLRRESVEAVAVCLLFSFANPRHEDAVAEALAPLGIPVSLSSRVLAEYREYERASTTTINAYLAPLMGRYLNRLGGQLGKTRLRVMQSNGGAVRADTAAQAPVHTIVSGPAGGVVGAFHVASVCGYTNIITFDMGGTSTDVALCEGSIRVTHEAEIDGLPVGIPIIDIHTVGAGGGSIAELDAGGALKVGPASAGAEPGPMCYGKGGERLTVTDANVLLGRLPARFFLGGTVPLAVDRIAPAAGRMPWTRKWSALHAVAQGIVDVVNNNMEHAIRLISVERGYDPRDFALVCFGGAGGLHAADLARALGIPRVVVPPHPGALSALGLLLSDVRKDYSKSMLIAAEAAEARIRRELEDLHRIGRRDLKAEGFEGKSVRVVGFRGPALPGPVV